MSNGERRRRFALVGDEVLVEGSAHRRRLLELAEVDAQGKRRALLLDPGLAARSTPTGGFSDAEIQNLKRSVLEARRLREVESATRRPVSHLLSTIAATLILGMVFVLPVGLEKRDDAVGNLTSAGLSIAPEAITHPGFEALGLPGARVYELADEAFSLVLIVDESFEL